MRINYRFLALLVAAVLVLGGVVFVVHRYQQSRSAELLLSQARVANEEGDLNAAAEKYSQYLGLNPKSVEAKGELGILLTKVGLYSKAYFNLESALRAHPNDLELREHLVTAARGIGRFQEAKETLEDYLLPEDADNVEYLGWLADCEQNLGNFDKARDLLSKALELDPSDVRIASGLAALYARHFEQPTQADTVLDALVEAAANDPVAHLTRGGWVLERAASATDSSVRDNKLKTATEDAEKVDQLLEFAPEADRPRLARQAAVLSAEVALARDDMPAARAAINRSIEATEKLMAEDTAEPTPQEKAQRAQMYAMAARVELRDTSVSNRLQKLTLAMQWLERGLAEYPENTNLLWDLSLCYIDAEQFEKVQGEKGTKARLAALGYPTGPLDFLEARILVAKDTNWSAAIDKLEQAQSLLPIGSGLVLQTDLLLAECHRRLENPDQEIKALLRALDTDPFLETAREALANAYLRTNRLQEAKSELAKLSVPSAAISLARIELVEGLKSGNPKAPQFKRVRDAINGLKDEDLSEQPGVASDLAILEAELFNVQQDAVQAEQTLRENITRDPKNEALWLALVNLQLRNENFAEAAKMLNAAQAQIPDSTDLRIARARLWIARDGQQVDLDKLTELAKPAEDWEAQDKRLLRLAFAQIFLALKEHDKSLQLLQPLAESESEDSDMGGYLLMFDVAYQTEQLDLMDKSLKAVERIEGRGPLWQVGNASRLALQAQQQSAETPNETSNKPDTSEKIEEALAQLEQAAELRPSWARIPSLRGELLDRLGKTDEALEAFVKAIELGESNPQLLMRTMNLLRERNDDALSGRTLAQIKQQGTTLSGDAARLASSLSLQVEGPQQALAQLESFAKNSEAQNDHLALAYLYGLNGRLSEAKDEYRRAIELEPSEPSAWVAYVRTLCNADLLEEARRVIDDAKESIDPEELANALALCYLALNDLETAKRYAQEALERTPDAPEQIRRVAELYIQFSDPESARPLLERLAGEEFTDISSADRDWAKRTLALNDGLSGNTAVSRNAIQSVREMTSGDPHKENVENWRTLAMLLGSERTGLAEAIDIMEEITGNQAGFSVTDQSLLARLYLASGDSDRYSRLMRDVFSKGGLDNPLLVRQHCNQLLNTQNVVEAEFFYQRLNELEPDTINTRTLEARLLFASEQYAKLVQLLKSKSSQAEYGEWSAQLSELFAGGLADQGESDQAQQLLELARAWFEQVSEEESEFKVSLANFHARQGNGEQLVALLKAGTPTEDQLADLGQVAMQRGRMDKEGMQQFLSIVEAAFAKNPASLSLGLCVGDIYGWMLNLDKAETIYRTVLEAHPRNFVALNNLAMVLTMTPAKHSQALQAINDAIDSKGPEDYLLDTRGIVFLALNRPQEAARDFEAALNVTRSPDRLFHMAAALQAQGRTDEAREYFEQAKTDGVSAKTLHPLEVASFEKLENQLTTRPVSAVR